MLNPIATYRFQFNKNFSFADFAKVTQYLQKLGVSTIYASPIFESVPGSLHGYDTTNPNKINPEIGSQESLEKITKKLRKQGIGWLQDIVPNHMAFHSNNEWLMDVLEKGYLSEFSCFFDHRSTDSSFFDGPIMVPFLGENLQDVINNGGLTVQFSQARLVLNYYDMNWPLHLRSYIKILSDGKNGDLATTNLINQALLIERIEDPKIYTLALKEFQMQLASLRKQPIYERWLQHCMHKTNTDKELLKQIVTEQEYRLCSWQETDHHINFRRFFTVNGLICINIQNKDAFNLYHRFTKTLLKAGVFQGLRIDHIDGLYDPKSYLEELRKLTGKKPYLYVEKILEEGETLPENWPVQGTTGYDFLALVNNLFTQKDNEKSFSLFYQRLSSDRQPLNQQILNKKRQILYDHMAGEFQNLFNLFLRSAFTEETAFSDQEYNNLKKAIGEFLIYCPIYRFYGNSFPFAIQEIKALQQIFVEIRKGRDGMKNAINLLESVLLERPKLGDKAYNGKILHFYKRCMQLTGPLMAKGVEDTLMYVHSRFIGHNEVGDSPGAFGISVEDFHQQMVIRQQKWPLSLNTTSTHDTKRGEDVRARLNVLSDLKEQWLTSVAEWQKLNQDLKQLDFPDANNEYFIYQTLMGSFPMPGEVDNDYESRIHTYLEKALREGKQHSDWAEPNENYEQAVKEFTSGLLNKKRPFWNKFKELHNKVADFGILNSLAQVLLKFTCPGVPDVYQGCELWDLSLVDPDNRRLVNYKQREQWLGEILRYNDSLETEVLNLWQNRYNGKIKLWLIHSLFQERKQHSDHFSEGCYIPLQIEGRYKKNVFAFARKWQKAWYIVAIPLHIATLSNSAEDILTLDWKNTRIILPPEIPGQYKDILLSKHGKVDKIVELNSIFKNLPLAFLKFEEPENDRSAGILMHISSLPSPFGIGDFGPNAQKFADFLSKSYQRVWQVLPLSPTEPENGHSPYSSCSSMAGNTLLISPELLVEEGLLSIDSIKKYRLPQESKVDYNNAERNKNILYEEAWNSFLTKDTTSHSGFQSFCGQEAYWLDDYALYTVIKKQHENKPWYNWPDSYKFRDPEELRSFSNRHQFLVNKTKWLQYVFDKQWKKLKTYCNNLGIQLFGDLPFYVSHDSVDVWAHPDIFNLDKSGKLKGIAGVPPDYFNEGGQLWGMPVFRWEILKKQKYEWWIHRIRKNLEFYDLLRLDHFRAFSAFWEVPEGETTAIKGNWKPGPGVDFFNTLKKEIGELPFVAEDLGDIDEAVYSLRDKFKLPGMKVLQFAFGDNLPGSDYAPHNYTSDFFVYSGTHDNNTIKAWFKEDITPSIKKQIKEYTGIKIKKANIHKVIIRLAFASVAKTAIIPLQDHLGLGAFARMNQPATITGNWLWRLKPQQLTPTSGERLRTWTRLYRRHPMPHRP